MRLQDELFLEANNPSFKLFADLVDNTVKSAITNIYGNFSEFTELIITQSMLHDMDNAFWQMLPTQYYTHDIMLGKPVKLGTDSITDNDQPQNEQLWDRYALFQFISNSRICNSHKFVWLAVVNAAADYGGTLLHVATHFGFATSQSALLWHLNSLHPYSKIILQTITIFTITRDLS